MNQLLEQIDPVFQALADPSRREVVRLLSAGPMRASDLASGVGLARNAMSRHLGVLRDCGLVAVELSATDARSRLYRLQGERLAEARDWIELIEREWRDQLGRFKRFAEAHTEPPSS